MEVRGERKCTACGTRWSYYETGEITCPSCGSVRSVGVDDRTLHTDTASALDLTPVRQAVGTEPLREVADRAADRAAAYVRTAGFVDGGELRPLGETYPAAAELRRVGASVARSMTVSDEEELYLLELLRVADDGSRPGPGEVPESLRAERGLAVTASVDGYLTDLRRWLDDREPAVDSVLSSVTTHRKRIEALDGDVDPAESERLLLAVRDLSAYLRDGDETALARAQERL